MIRAILFDMGGTLDGDGLHWLDRFVALYRAAGITVPREGLRSAFDSAEARAGADDAIARAGIDEMVTRHVDWQLEYLWRGVDSSSWGDSFTAALADGTLRRRLIDGFVGPIRTATAANGAVLCDLAGRYRLGVVSNGCGNVHVLCRDYGYAPYLSAIVDSRRVGLSKPDPRIFTHAASMLGMVPGETLVVGDSFERDIAPAHSAGMTTAWLQPDGSRAAPVPAAVNMRLERLADLPAALRVLVPAS